ncbi:MAG: bifunctional methylenetetrahydrofolate dehydrogenase/methenyltetrahydrofolate cyclohydrolase [Planctomyces sp.]|nr:bifunctional methylenetetrahydrofolate dehydrogenase/methenyltetrahydrofolate cyclohydrolase [Planctomyces sp.]MBA4039333.1 bifunctional methylenetetrahydrofolate dehydrogenase/methenyltetrahydrofolate cyclohydrolase [Planctomyces sp.]MBA4119279.1 bifunctional methylenetetrahydrofolate dehydrogenase/methenyltetrahydrofolate cyclohydrolase [Isosphaera sp.]
MSARLIDGKALAARDRVRTAALVARLRRRGVPVRLDALLCAAGDSAARVYAENQGRTCAELGIDYRLHDLPAGATMADLERRVGALNADPACTGVMLHMPLPEGVNAYALQSLIDPAKDVEGVNPANIGNVVYGRSSLAPCTGLAVVRMVESTGIAPEGGLRGRRAVVIGASDVVGKPIAVLLMRSDATVISCNKWTPGIEDLMRSADVLVAAAGVPGLVRAEHVKFGAVVIDVGVNRVPGPDGRAVTTGDVVFERVRQALGPEGWISPVPGGVGPMTVAMLLRNVAEAAARLGREPIEAP